MIFNFFKKDKRSEHKKLIDEIDAAYLAKGGKKISDETIRKAEETLKQVYEQGEKTELRLLTEVAEELRKEKLVKETVDQSSKKSILNWCGIHKRFQCWKFLVEVKYN